MRTSQDFQKEQTLDLHLPTETAKKTFMHMLLSELLSNQMSQMPVISQIHLGESP